MVALLASVSISLSVICKLCCLCSEKLWERRDDPDMGLCLLSKQCCMFRMYKQRQGDAPTSLFPVTSLPKQRQAGGQDAGCVPSDSLKLNTLQRASYFLKMNSTLWWGKLNTSSHFPILPRQLLPVPLCHVDANPLQQLFVFFSSPLSEWFVRPDLSQMSNLEVEPDQALYLPSCSREKKRSWFRTFIFHFLSFLMTVSVFNPFHLVCENMYVAIWLFWMET